jgi:hypothetical protein
MMLISVVGTGLRDYFIGLRGHLPRFFQREDQEGHDDQDREIQEPGIGVGAGQVVDIPGNYGSGGAADPHDEKDLHAVGRPQDVASEPVGQQVRHQRGHRPVAETEQERINEQHRDRGGLQQEEHRHRHQEKTGC